MSSENQSNSAHIENARNEARNGKVVNIPSLDAAVYIDKKTGEFAIAAKSPEAITEISRQSMGKDAIHINKAVSPTNVMRFSNERNESQALVAVALKNLGVSKEDMAKVANLSNEKEAPTKKDAGNYITPPDKIPHEIKAFIDKRLGHDADGNQRTENGAPVKPSVFPAKENGSYKGKVILNTETHLVQSIGKDEKTAVVHEKANLEMVGNRLKWRDENQKLHNADIQIHYKDGKGKAFPHASEKEQPQKTTAPERVGFTPEQYIEKAQIYAAQNIKNAKSRESFLKHVENMAKPELTQNKQASPKQPAKAQSSEQER